MDPTNVEDYYWIKYNKYSKKVTVKPSRRRGPDKIRSQKKGLNDMNLSSLSINSSAYINDSLYTYYKMLWGKCRKHLLNKCIHSF